MRERIKVLTYCISPDSRYAAAGSMDGSLIIWNTLNGKTEKTISKAHEYVILSSFHRLSFYLFEYLLSFSFS